MTVQALCLADAGAYNRGEASAAERMTITSEQVRAARALLRWDQSDLAEATGLAVITIKKIEGRQGRLMVLTSSQYAIMEAFERAGVIFTEPDNGGAGVRWKRGYPKEVIE